MSAVIPAWLNLAVLNVFVLTVTAAVIIWYTIETCKLRKTAQLQTELQTRPFVSLARTGSGDRAKFYVHNAGHGLARNVSFEEVRFDPPSYSFRGESISYLGPGKDAFPVWLAVSSFRPGGVPDELPDEDLINFALARKMTTFALSYKSILGWTYTTAISVNSGRIDIVSDSGEQPRPDRRRR